MNEKQRVIKFLWDKNIMIPKNLLDFIPEELYQEFIESNKNINKRDKLIILSETSFNIFLEKAIASKKAKISPVEPCVYFTENRVISKEMRYQILSEQKWRCNSCNCVLKMTIHSAWDGEVAHIDHIYPFADRYSYNGNINERINLQALCPKCNRTKYKRRD